MAEPRLAFDDPVVQAEVAAVFRRARARRLERLAREAADRQPDVEAEAS